MEIEIASTNTIPPGKMTGVEKSGQFILVANVNGKYYAIGDVCTHRGCNLSGGTLDGETVHCPCHGSVFNVKTGAVIKGPANGPEQSYALRVDGDKIFADI